MTDRVKRLVVECLELSNPPDFDDSTPLFEGGLGMDSFAAVQLINLIESDFDIEFDVADDAIRQAEPKHRSRAIDAQPVRA